MSFSPHGMDDLKDRLTSDQVWGLVAHDFRGLDYWDIGDIMVMVDKQKLGIQMKIQSYITGW